MICAAKDFGSAIAMTGTCAGHGKLGYGAIPNAGGIFLQVIYPCRAHVPAWCCAGT